MIQSVVWWGCYWRTIIWFLMQIGILAILGIILRQISLFLQGPPGEQGARGEAGAKGDKVRANTLGPKNTPAVSKLQSTQYIIQKKLSHNNVIMWFQPLPPNIGSSNSSSDHYYEWTGSILYTLRLQCHHYWSVETSKPNHHTTEMRLVLQMFCCKRQKQQNNATYFSFVHQRSYQHNQMMGKELFCFSVWHYYHLSLNLLQT